VVTVIEMADRLDAFHAVGIAQPTPKGIARVGRVGDQCVLHEHLHDLIHQARLGILRMYVKEAGHLINGMP
jgi:hypothetical protein